MLILWRVALGIVAGLSLLMAMTSGRWRLLVVSSGIFVAAITSVAVIVTILQVEEHRARTEAGKETVHWQMLTLSGMPAGPAASWGPNIGASRPAGHPEGAAASSPLPA